MQGVIDTVLNRLASDQFPDTVEGVANQRRQFSGITGPAYLDPYGSISKVPANVVPNGFDTMVNSYLDARQFGTPSSVGGNLHYANPTEVSGNNTGWVSALTGPRMGQGDFVHQHGTTRGFTPVEAVLVPDFEFTAAGKPVDPRNGYLLDDSDPLFAAAMAMRNGDALPEITPASLGAAASAAMPNEWPAVPPIQREIPPPPRPRPPDAAPPLPLRRPDRPQAQPAFQGRSLGDDLALSPIQGGPQEMPLFDGAYDPVIDAIRPTVPYDGRGIGFVSTEAPREAALLPPIAPPAPRSAPKPATQSRMLAAQRDARDVGAGFQERYGDLLPMLETSGGSAPPTMPVMPSSDMRLMRSANNMAQQEAAAPAPSAPRPPSTYDVGLARALEDRTTRPAAVLPTAEQLAAATGFRAAPSSRPMSEMAAIYSQGGPTRPAQPAVVRTGQITPLPPSLTPNGAIVQGKVQDRLTADLLPEPIPVGGGMNPTLARPAPVPAPLSSRPPAPPARPVAPTTSTRVAPVPLPASARPLTGTGGVDIDMPQMPAVPTVAPVPAQRLARPGVFGSPKLGPWDIKLPGALGVVQDLTAAMNNASGPFSNGADNLAYNVMRGGDFNAPGAATGRAGGYLYAPKEGGGFINVGRADRTMSAAELYDSLNARNSEPRNAAERAKSNSRRYDSGPSSLWE